jgi:hypothetical protein
MRASYAGTVIAPGGLLGEPGNLRINGKPINEAAQFFRAAAMTWFTRANYATEISFSVTRNFGDLASAGVFACTHGGSLAGQGDLVLTLGDSGDTATETISAAVLQSVQVVMTGVAVTVTYTFSGGNFG